MGRPRRRAGGGVLGEGAAVAAVARRRERRDGADIATKEFLPAFFLKVKEIRKAAPRVDRNALSARGDGVPPRRSRSSSPDAPPAKRASSAGSSVCGYDSEAPEEIQNEALYRACRAYGLGEQFLAAAQDEGTFGEWLDELPFEVAAATARLLKHHARSGAWIEITPGSPSQARRAGRDRDRGPHLSPNCPPDMSEPSDYSD